MPRYAIAQHPTPILSTSDFKMCFGGRHGDSLPLDTQQLLRPIETVLFPLSPIEMLERIPDSPIWHIRTSEYSEDKPLYIDERFVAPIDVIPPQRNAQLPSMRCIAQHLLEQLGVRYIWGGNWPRGIPQLLQWYAPSIPHESLDVLTQDTWQLKGVDCSGLLYYACNGYTPRNTSQLVDWGFPVPIADTSVDQILNLLFPLDLIVWKGHVVIVLDERTVIESKAGQGVIISSLKERLNEISSTRKPVNAFDNTMPSFVVRRWHPDLMPC